MEEIEKRWSEFSAVPFPAEAHLDDANLELIDSDIAGCVISFLSTNGELERWKVKALKQSIEELKQEWEKIPHTARGYFRELQELGETVLSHN